MPTYPRRATFQVGGVVFPLTNPGTQDLPAYADPVIYNLLQFYRSCINTYIGTDFAAQATKVELKSPDGVLITSPVMQVVPYHPADYLQEDQFKFPLLSAGRTKGVFREKTRQWYEKEYDLQILYMLPPLTSAQMFQLDYRAAVSDIILDRLELGYDPAYKSGQLVWKTAGIEEIVLTNETYVGIENPKNVKTFFPTLMLDCHVKERKMYVQNSYPPFTGIDGEVDVSDGYQPNNYDLIDFKIDV